MTPNKKRIQLPWIEEENEAQKLRELKTIQYWRTSRNWNGFGTPVTVHYAMSQLNNVLSNMDPNKRLAQKAQELLDDLINFGSKTTKMRNNKKANNNEITQTQCKTFIL